MYARLTNINVRSIDQERADVLAEQVSGIFEGLPGYQSVTFFVDDDRTMLGAFSVWDTQEQAAANHDAVRTAIQSQLNGALTGPPDTRVYRVFDKQA